MFLGVTAPKTLMKGFLDFSRKIFIFSLHKTFLHFPSRIIPSLRYFNVGHRPLPAPHPGPARAEPIEKRD